MFPACHPSRKPSSARQKWYVYASPTHLFSERRNVGRYTSPLVFKNNLDSQVKFFHCKNAAKKKKLLLTALCTKILVKDAYNSV